MLAPPLASWALPLGAILDVIVGDPRGWPHPVRAIGRLVSTTERALRALLKRSRGGPAAERAAGVILAAAVVGTTGLTARTLVVAGDRISPIAGLLARTLLVFWGLAIRSLGDEALRASEAPDLPTARRELAMIVGRDTETLDQAEVCRACVETVAENCNDAVIAPLFWYAIGGPVALWAYKAVSTLDSMVGYRNDRYRRLGWASARLDDVLAFIPARLTWLLIALAACLLGERARAALVIGWRDGRKHPSPNSAWGEAAMAGALGVRLGGLSTYGDVPSVKPHLGDGDAPLEPATVRRAVRLMRTAAALAICAAWTLPLLPSRPPLEASRRDSVERAFGRPRSPSLSMASRTDEVAGPSHRPSPPFSTSTE